MTTVTNPPVLRLGDDRPPLRPFDFEHYHQLRFGGPIRCPRCGCGQVHSWGRFGRRRRFRCVGGCGRTFSSFTATPLAYVKRIDLWSAHLECMRARHSTRLTGRLLGCHRDTAFRWRHRWLSAGVAADFRQLSGRVELGSIWLSHSRKGKRGLGEDARARGVGWGFGRGDIRREWVVVACQGSAGQESPGQGSVALAPTRLFAAEGVIAIPVGSQRPSGTTYERHLLPRLRTGRAECGSPPLRPLTLVGRKGRFGPEARLARLWGAGYEQTKPRGFWTPEIWRFRVALQRWLRPFRGVASRYLANYLFWFGAGGPAYRISPSGS